MRLRAILAVLITLAAIPAGAQVMDANGNTLMLATQGTGAGAATNFWNFRLTDGTNFYDGLKVGQLPAALVGGRLDVNLGAWLGSTAPTVGQKAMASSLPVTLASDQSALAVNQTQWASTAVDTNSGLKSAGTLRVVLATDQPALTNKLLVTPDSVALPANQSVNVAQLAATTTDTNSGLKSAGTLRVVLATDQPALTNKLLVTPDSVALPANQSVNLNQVAGAGVATGNGTAAGSIRVTQASDSTGQMKITDGTTVAGVIVATTALKADVASIAGTATGTAAAGVQKVGIVGNANAAVDAANNASAPANVLVAGAQLQSGAQATAGTAGQVGSVAAGLDHVLYVRTGGPVYWHCGLTTIGATLTQCKAAPAAGLKAYVTDITIMSDTGTAGQFTLRYGTGSNCATGTTTLFPDVASITAGKWQYQTNVATSQNPVQYNFTTPLQPTAANAVCIICVATQTCTVSMQGYEAP